MSDGSLFEVQVAVATPQHAGLGGTLSYLSERPLPPGSLVRVPLARREVTGLVWAASGEADPVERGSMKHVAGAVESFPPLSAAWCRLVEFAAGYYQRGIGEMALAVLPPELRKLDSAQITQRIDKLRRRVSRVVSAAEARAMPSRPALSDEQREALDRLAAFEQRTTVDVPDTAPLGTPRTAAATPDAAQAARARHATAATPVPSVAAVAAPTVLLHGVTGSGKTEVYLAAVERVLEAGGQALIMVPEINLTPQLESRFSERFAGRVIVSLHSGLTPAQRLGNWLAAHLGLADLVLGTRLAVFASMPRLGLVVVDEEHDPSYKQQDGARYSARDLSVWRGRNEGVPVLLGSATPSLETWQRATEGKYLRLALNARIGGGTLPRVRLVDMAPIPKATLAAQAGLAPALLAALRERLERGEQSLVFLNRRGYAPVLHCSDCGWKSGCPHCSAWRVFHKLDRTLRCHHCGLTDRVPRACPECGNLDVEPMGRGTEKLEEQLGGLLRRPDDTPARVLRIDADSTRRKGELEAQLATVHAGDVDVLVGTQMVTKGHDFRRITLVAAINPDGSLFSSDFRASERLFALLMQAGGRAGRDAAHAASSEMWVQTWHPTHPLYAALVRHDFHAFAASQLAERAMAGLPPYSHLAMLRAEATTQEAARGFLDAAATLAGSLEGGAAVTVYPSVPQTVARVADIERAQMLIESTSRVALQRFLARWLPALHGLRSERKAPEQRVIRWAVDVDPLTI